MAATHSGKSGARRQRAAAIMVLVAMLTGCAVGPNFQTPDAPDVTGYLGRGGAGEAAIPGQALARRADIPDRWWELFRSRHLNALITQGIAKNAELEAAEAALRVAQANALAQRGALFPAVGAIFNPTRQKVATQALTSSAVGEANIYNLHTAQVTVTFVPDVFGGLRREYESAEALAEAQAFQYEGVYLSLSANIALAAIQEASLRGQIAATRRLIEIQTQLLEILRRQNAAGQIALPDVVLQETAVAQARLLLPPLEKQLSQQRNLLAVLTGQFPSESTASTFQLGSFTLPRRLPLSVPADLVRQRPDVRAAEAALHAASAQVGVAIANRLPQITLTAANGSAANAISRLFSPDTGFWTLAANIAQPVLDGEILANKQRAAEAAHAQAAAQYRSTVLVAFQNVADTLRALQADARTLDAAIAAEQSASRSIDLVRRQVEQGQVSLPALLNAQQAYLQTSVARVQAEAARLADTVALFQALGGGWWNRPNAAPKQEQALQ
jgi:NodT family efflux transporter outer membrane factor (OMF) lipoprotein